MLEQRQACNQTRAYLDEALKSVDLLTDSREKSLARTKMEEAAMWLDKLYFKERSDGVR